MLRIACAMAARRALITGITGPGRLLSRGAAARQGLRGPRHRPPRGARGSRAPSLAARPASATGCDLHAASLESYASILQRRRSRCSRTSATTWRRRASSATPSTTSSPPSTPTSTAPTSSARPHQERWRRDCRFYFAGSSEMFGHAEEVPQNERTPFHPRSTYGISKVAGFDLTRNYREAYRMHASQRHPLQPRIAPPRLRVRHAQDHLRRRAHPAPERPRSCAWATWMPSATGAMPASTSRPCG